MEKRNRANAGTATAAAGVLAVAFGGWFALQAMRVPPRPVYTPAGYGGHVPAPTAPDAGAAPTKPPADGGKGNDPVAGALSLYGAGKWKDAEAEAQRVVARQPTPQAGATKPVPTRHRARARWVLAFAAARRRDLRLARERFADLRREAAGELWTLDTPRELRPGMASGATEAAEETPLELQDRPVSPEGRPLPTLEEEGAYQHAVLTAALERSEARAGSASGEAEREFVEFIRRYPESPLMHAAVRRIARMHGGDVPAAAEAVRKQAVATAEARQHARQTARSLCAPEVLAEILRRGKSAGETSSEGDLEPKFLARELKTDHQGTTLSALAAALGKRGFHAKGLRLTWKGLWRITHGPHAQEDAPEFVIALMRPGHFVLAEEVAAGWVDVWDPSGNGPDQPGRLRYPRTKWEALWTGVVLRVDGG